MNYEDIKENDVIYRCIGDNFDQGILSCGFMRKRTAERSQYDFKIGYYSCFLILQGNGRFISKDGTVTLMQAGDLVQRLPDRLHSTEIEPNGGWLEFYISVGYPVYHYLRELGIIISDKEVQAAQLTTDFIYDFVALLNTLKGATDEKLPYLLMRAQELIIRLHGSINNTQSEQNESKITKACQLIGGSSNIHYDIKQAAAVVNMGYENFRKLFKETTGLSPKRYHIEQIMKQAKMMLLSGLPIKHVAVSLGYGDIYSFTKQFTKSEGISPGRYIRD
ncbi:helix-turn-helix domain-containing protein [Paenibacillus sp. PL91]|uniref:helix-turn-helix domain-containing protein n=1 Tax=Paenibacillus sp. PL91 TaxID=2729538 RepID=UPI00145EC768|nr:AraC family transcriptional regulator [Paenibacillus sp. PL91]MBC9198729.1 helix-turn-helix transcriptional regulator [Paenibacillus sp. PL91]